jgi:phage-related protein
LEADDDRGRRRVRDPDTHGARTPRVLVAKYDEAVYVIHAFEKRTPQTREADIALARKRLADLLGLRGHKKKGAR